VQDNDETARRFASRFFGVDANHVKLVGESYVEREWPKQRYKPSPPLGDGMGRLNRVLRAVTEPVQVNAIREIVQELSGQMFDTGNDWRETLHDHLVTNEYVYQTTQILKQPQWLDAAAWQTSQRLGLGRLPEGERATAELLCYLVLGAAARKAGDCLESMGLSQGVYDGLSPQLPAVQNLAEMLGVAPNEMVDGISLILDNWRRARIVYVQGDPVFSRYHAKDDPYIQHGLLPLKDFRPEGLLELTRWHCSAKMAHCD
jgi:hypothetical protein